MKLNGKKIASRRESLEMSQTELAKRAKISQSLISKIEANKNKIDPAFSTVIRILVALEIEITFYDMRNYCDIKIT